MLLSKLVYLAIKNITYFDDMAFTYEAFLQGKYNHDSDYATNINSQVLSVSFNSAFGMQLFLSCSSA